MPNYDFPVPCPRGIKNENVSCNQIDHNGNSSCVNGIIINPLLGRYTTQNGETHELETIFNPNINALDIDVPDYVLDAIETIGLGPNYQRYRDWLFGADGEGSIGPQGFQGSIGSQGFQGSVDLQGFQGPIGSTGAQGFQGFQGPTGSIGSDGAQGFQGLIGFQGLTGPQGFQGLVGIQGPVAVGDSISSLIKHNIVNTSTDTDASYGDLLICDATGGAITITLPSAINNAGKEINIKKIDSSANQIIVDGNGAETIDGEVTQSISAQHENLTIVSDGSNFIII